MDAMKVNAFISSISPPDSGPDEIRNYLAAVTKALGVRSDAGLARSLRVPAATLASWKHRGSIPAEYHPWFQINLVVEVANLWHLKLPPEPGDIPIAAAVELLRRTGCDVLETDGESGRRRVSPVVATAWAFGGLVTLASLLLELDPGLGNAPSDLVIDDLANLLEGAVPTLRKALL